MSEGFPAYPAGLGPGSLLAGYRLEAQVGAGGMALVFRARDQRLDRLVALKVMAAALVSDPAFRRRFIAESRAAAKVDDPHIIPVHEADEADGVLFIAMRFVAGGDLRAVLEREGPLAGGRAAEFISPVASALDAAHAAGLVHRDVKPGNILVDARAGRPDHVYLSDFGIAKALVSSVSLTEPGFGVGTPDYLAPEQIGGLAVDGRADQYALACVTYRLLTGVPPFERDHGMSVMYAHLHEPPPPLAARRPDLPGAVGQVLARGMAKASDQRYGSCGDFADALREALGLPPYRSGGPVTSVLSQASAVSPSQAPGPQAAAHEALAFPATVTIGPPGGAPVPAAIPVTGPGNRASRAGNASGAGARTAAVAGGGLPAAARGLAAADAPGQIPPAVAGTPQQAASAGFPIARSGLTSSSRQLAFAGSLAAASAVLVFVGLAPVYMSGRYLNGTIAWFKSNSFAYMTPWWSFFIVGAAALSLTAGVCTLVRRWRSLYGNGLLLATMAAATSALAYNLSHVAPSFNDGVFAATYPLSYGSGYWIQLGSSVSLILAGFLVIAALAWSGEVRFVRLPRRNALPLSVILLGAVGAVALACQDFRLWFHPAGSPELISAAIPSLLMAGWALIMPALAVAVMPRRFGVALLGGWIWMGAAYCVFSYLFFGSFKGLDYSYGIPVVVFGLTLLALAVTAIRLARVESSTGPAA